MAFSADSPAETAIRPAGAANRRFALKAATNVAHARVEAIIQSAGLLDSLSGYRRFLAATWVLRHQHETPLDAAGAAGLWPLWPSRRISMLAARDMADLGIAAPEQPAQLHAALTVGELLATLYVLEGSSLGARLIARSVGALGLTAGYGARHLHAQAGDASAWRSFLALLEASSVPPCHDTANAVFDRFAAAYGQAAG